MRDASSRPVARWTGVVTAEAGGDLLVYDLERHRAHSLNAAAAAVWRRADGSRTPAAIAAAGDPPGGAPLTEDAVRHALAQLGRAALLATPWTDAGPSRRELLRRAGTAAILALPVVTSITAPTAAHAQSPACFPLNVNESDVCEVDSQCCDDGICSVTRCCLPDTSPCSESSECCSTSCLGGQCVD
jgi:hypothetical protein